MVVPRSMVDRDREKRFGRSKARAQEFVFPQPRGPGVMDTIESRFKTSEIALRFFFRVRELLYGGRAERLRLRELPTTAKFTSRSAIDDYRSIGWCMRGLD